jgi:hypothetical protein
VPSDPFCERNPRQGAGGELKNYPLLFIDAALNLVTVHKKERLHSGMANPFVPVNECMVHDQRVAKGRGLGDKVRVKVLAAEGGVGLTDCGLERAEIPYSGGAAGVGKQPLVQFEDLGDG